jgi:predicted PurR-regulated permease PerM/GAF domain-containing protein
MAIPAPSKEASSAARIPAADPGSPSVPDPNGAAAPAPASSIVTAAVILLTITALYFGREIFLPFTLAILLSFMLARPVEWLRRLRIPRVVAVVTVVVTAFLMIAGISMLVGAQVISLANNLPSYQKTMQEKIRSIRGAAVGGGPIDRTTAVIEALGRELSDTQPAPRSEKHSAPSAQKKEPIPVTIEPARNDPLTVAQNMIVPLLGPIGTAGLVIVFIFFVLLEPSDLRDRFIRLAGSDLHRTTEALSEAAERVGRYLLMQLVVNASYGVPLGIGLYLIGVPSAFLWALLATLLRFVPYLGPVIAAVFPLTLAFAVDPGWNMLLWTAGLVAVLELISNNVIEPWLYGSSTGMTPVAVILAAIFWTLLWGPVGLILATPLTVCLVVMGRYVPQLAFLDVLLGSDPVLSPEERLYQRLLAGNVEEAIEIAELHVAAPPDAEEQPAADSLLGFYDQVGLPALRLAENARQRGASTQDRKKVADGLRAVVQDLRDISAKREENGKEEENDAAYPAHPWFGTPVLCIAGRGELDSAAAVMLVHALESKGIGARHAGPSAVTHERIGELDLAGVEVVCLVYLGPAPQAYARFACRRLKRRMPQLKIVLCAWNLASESGTPEQVAANAGADAAPASIDAAVRWAADVVGRATLPSMPPPPLPPQENGRLEALQASGILDPGWRSHLDRVARKVADAFETPIGLVTLVDDSCQLWKGAAGLPDELEKTRQGERETSICSHVVAGDAPLVVEDTARDLRFAHNPFLRQHGLRFYAGAPLRTASGHVIGSLCVIDTKPRTLSPREVKLLQVIADELMAEVAKQPAGAPDGFPEARNDAAGTGEPMPSLETDR